MHARNFKRYNYAMEEARREEIMRLVHAQMAPRDIAKSLKIALSIVYSVKSRCMGRGTVRRKFGSGKPISVSTPRLVRAIEKELKGIW